MVWDQGERDKHCVSAPGTLLTHTKRYPCLERQLISTWRAGFVSNFSFLAVQLPGYIGDCDSNGLSPFVSACVPGVFEMRLAQEAGTTHDPHAGITATYDLGCPFGVKTVTFEGGTTSLAPHQDSALRTPGFGTPNPKAVLINSKCQYM